eukprot:CAMPEP_0172732448 /NCGR_PEP_ID=MMETSP1074-20121228/104324_1 /TAXON_ID=2916 /ORGANISM="Ceratium fusus, Strain PA161109" /LENGTH=38 /DNA_ID= /DNA_START= /DNA_END= /DNA_ORIENTATION=
MRMTPRMAHTDVADKLLFTFITPFLPLQAEPLPSTSSA